MDKRWLRLPLCVAAGAFLVYLFPGLPSYLLLAGHRDILERPGVWLALSLPLSVLLTWRPCVTNALRAQRAYDLRRASDEALSPEGLRDRMAKQGTALLLFVGVLLNFATTQERSAVKVPTMPAACMTGVLVVTTIWRTTRKRSLIILQLYRYLFCLVLCVSWLANYSASGDPFFLQRRMAARNGPHTTYRFHMSQLFAVAAGHTLASPPELGRLTVWLVLHMTVLSLPLLEILRSSRDLDRTDCILMSFSWILTCAAL